MKLLTVSLFFVLAVDRAEGTVLMKYGSRGTAYRITNGAGFVSAIE